MGLADDFEASPESKVRYERLLSFAVKNLEAVDPAQSAQLIHQVERLLEKLERMPSDAKDILDDVSLQRDKRRAEAQKRAAGS